MNHFIPTLYICELTNMDIDINILGMLPPERQHRIVQSVKREKAKQLYAASLLLAYILSQYGVTLDEIKTTEMGKPYAPFHPYFNVSHSGKYVAVAIANHEVGVDIQEKISISSLQPGDCRLYIWCRKEALLKCLGTGWDGENGHKFSVLENKIEYQGAKYYLTDYTIAEDYYLSLCEKDIHKEFVIEEVSKRELTLFYRTNSAID